MVTIRAVSAEEVGALKGVRLEALRESPAAFGSTYAAEAQLAESEWVRRATPDASGRSITFLAYAAATPCGIVRGRLDDRVEATAFVQSMWVAPGQRRLGVGGRLIEAVADWALARDVRTLKLTVTSSNEPAIRFYERLGFTMTGRVQPYPNDPGLLEYEMGKVLGPLMGANLR
jgi:ribosomal protein S18 acetylase RimI-like enzyme